ncbi:TetR/AcrR family transcriptional regulator [Halobacterium bonnevillei]|uniref:TetR family transcriptional regulator n=1 Tax=Halobacterium bonnevillei TaxID=2692200 RepID=A0A6B0SMB6_9EURY|nr:TetR/AcrR family transcriptional regulator [Halobacterium bonnevillei]MXR20050.1 TetR family transcriptional regulator [Halobacterium bonnevillei]
MSRSPDTEQRIREAAFRALVEHGYADLSIKDIGDELEQNPSLIYHYFDSKDDLLLSMLEEFVEQFVDWQAERTAPDAEAELRQFVSQILHPDPSSVEEMTAALPHDIETANARMFVELWAHATWDGDFRRKTTEVDARLQATIAGIVQSGIGSGQFRTVDAELTADHLLFLVKQGLHTRATTNREDSVERTQELVDEVIEDLSATA